MDPDKSTTVLAIPPMVSSPVAVASTVCPKIFQFYPLPGLLSEGDHFYYDSAVDISCGDFAACVAYATHYDLLLVINACPSLAAFQVAHPLANIWHFSEISPWIIPGCTNFLLWPLWALKVF
jgi:hypothetical protein